MFNLPAYILARDASIEEELRSERRVLRCVSPSGQAAKLPQPKYLKCGSQKQSTVWSFRAKGMQKGFRAWAMRVKAFRV